MGVWGGVSWVFQSARYLLNSNSNFNFNFNFNSNFYFYFDFYFNFKCGSLVLAGSSSPPAICLTLTPHHLGHTWVFQHLLNFTLRARKLDIHQQGYRILSNGQINDNDKIYIKSILICVVAQRRIKFKGHHDEHCSFVLNQCSQYL